jgi:hypothetical protein
MEFDKLLNPVAEYLNFVVDFALLQGIEAYTRQGTVSAKLVSFFFIGLILAFIIRRLKRFPTFSDDSELRLRQITQPAVQDRLFGLSKVFEISELMAFVPFIISGSVAFHLSLLGASALYGFQIGNIKDSINATLMVSAISNPIQSSFTRLLLFIKQIENYNRKSRLFALAVNLIYLAFVFIQGYYYLFAITIIHKVTFGHLWLPLAITSAIIVLYMLIYFYCVRIWRTMYEPNLTRQP